MHELFLIIHFIGLALGLGSGFANLLLSSTMSKMSPEEARAFALKIIDLRKLSYIGIFLLILSGFYLMSPWWQLLSSSPLLITKLVLVVILAILTSIIKGAGDKFKKGDFSQGKYLKPLSRIALVITLLIVVLAVSFFG